MRIGLFTDSYHPATNGITFVVDIIRNGLEERGHEVFVIAPGPITHFRYKHDPHVVHFRAIKGIFFEEQLTSLFFPPRQVRKIDQLDLDLIMFFTPSQIGLLGVYSAKKLGIPLIAQYSTDLVEYVERYPLAVAGGLALFLSNLLVLELTPRDILSIAKSIAVSSNQKLSRKQDMIQKMLSALHSSCDAIISVSPKVSKEIKSWDIEQQNIHTVATGVDPLPIDQIEVSKFKKKYKLLPEHHLLLYVGRLSKEKNLELLIRAHKRVLVTNPMARLIMVGDFSYRQKLELLCEKLGIDDKVIFTGRIERAKIGSIYAAADIFCFPSITDTQALVLNEAALASLPLVWCDVSALNEVLIDGVSGLRAEPTSLEFAKAINLLINDPSLRRKYGKNAQLQARKFSQSIQTDKLIGVFKSVLPNL